MCEQLRAVLVTVVNPLNDPDGKMGEKLVDGIVEALRVRLRSTTDGRRGSVLDWKIQGILWLGAFFSKFLQ
jgi:hypothetical protein